MSVVDSRLCYLLQNYVCVLLNCGSFYRRKPQNLTPPGSDDSGSSSLSHHSLSPPAEGNFESSKGTKRPVQDNADIPHKKTRVSHFKKPGSGGGLNGNGANANTITSRPELTVKQEKDGWNGLSPSPQFTSQNNRVAERLSPFEHMDLSPSNDFHSSSQGDAILDEPVTVGSSWPSRNGNHDSQALSDSEKPSRGDSDETDSIDSGNGSSTSAGSVTSQHQNYKNGYVNGTKPFVAKNESAASSDRVSSTTNFHNTPQSSPDSQLARDRERDRLKEKERLKERDRDSRNKDRMKRNGFTMLTEYPSYLT